MGEYVSEFMKRSTKGKAPRRELVVLFILGVLRILRRVSSSRNGAAPSESKMKLKYARTLV